jgi:hypothetical protein
MRNKEEGNMVYSTTSPSRCRDAFRGLRAPSSGGLHGAGGNEGGAENPYRIPLIVVFPYLTPFNGKSRKREMPLAVTKSNRELENQILDRNGSVTVHPKKLQKTRKKGL